MNSSKTADPAVSGTPTDLTAEQRDILHSSLRVDQVGEVAADYIYRGQLAVLKNDPKCGPIIQVGTICMQTRRFLIRVQEMWNQEKKHLAVMHKLRAQHDVRPTALWEVAKVAGFGLGAVSALLGREAAMACTEAVETVIGEHYDE
jgi:ubiquinone biosynthesis monooxygenase Coq7